AARTWMRGVLLEAVRQGLDAKNRVERILRQRGTRGLIEEIAFLNGDYPRRIYFEALLQSKDVSNQDLKTALRNASTSIKGDYEKDSFLIKGAENYQGDAALRTEWLNAVRTIGSDYEHHRALTSALKSNEISAEALADLVTSAARIQSDYEKAAFLLEAMKHYRSDARLRTAFVETARTISSEYERGRVQKSFDRANF